MTTITEFLLTRVSEDELRASYYGAALGTARILSECKAKRAIVELHTPHSRTPYDCPTCGSESIDFHSSDLTPIAFPCPTIRALTSVYADHPNFDSGWEL